MWCKICKTKIVRNQGCNHMTCYTCKYYFCYICEGPVGSCLCDAVPVRNRYLRFLGYSLAILIIYAAIPMVMVIGLPILCIFACLELVGENCCDYSSDDRRFMCTMPAVCVGLNCGLLCSPLAIVGTLCVGPFFVCYGAGALTYEMYQNRQHA